MVAEMGGLAEKQIADAIEALAERDAELARRVIAADPRSTRCSARSRRRRSSRIARRQPMAVDLREIVGALRVANDLERIGDLAKNIGKRVLALGGDFHPQKLIRGVEHMARAGARPAQAGARRLCRARPRQGARGLEGRRGDRRACAPRCSASC